MDDKLQALKAHLQEATDLGLVGSLLSWDQATYMPPGGGPARGRQMALIGRLAHERSTAPEIGRLLDELEAWAAAQPYDSDEAGLVRAARRNYDRLVKVPAPLLAEFYAHSSVAYQAWAQARPKADFTAVAPLLQKTLDLSRRIADCFPGYAHIADPLIDVADDGMTVASLRPLFAELRAALVPIVQALTAQPPADDRCLRQHFPEDAQRQFGERVIQQLGYDFTRGRQDKTHHPFMTKFSLGDVRITTRFQEHDLSDGLFSTIHEAGHAMYEQGIDPAFEGTPLANGTSAGVHESQSRLWENVVGRSRGFWEHFYPELQAIFPEQLGAVSLDTFHRAINKVQRSLIRTDADEVTYNLHVLIRFDLELALLEGTLAIQDLPEAWHARYQADLGVRAPDDRDGCLQDVHWFGSTIGGAFQGYTLGNLMGAQFYAAAQQARPDLPAQIARGEFGALHGWLRENVLRHGRKYTAPELIQRVTGGPLDSGPYLRYLREKYGALYALPQ